ncbi:MAG: rhomboid family intramembrane serine protease [archaeon]|nr:rhomboid family intramembrane serine protease [archaeon]
MKNQKYVSLWLCTICVIVFLIQLLIPEFTGIFMLTPEAPVKIWQFLTAVFLHGGIVHLLYNLFALFLFGLILEGFIGSKKFLGLFLISGILANIISFLFYPNINALGASGAIMAIIGTLAVLRPGMTVWAYNVPMPMFVAAIFWVGAGIFGILGLGDQSVGHLAHLSGIFIGVIYGSYLRLRYPFRKVGFSSSHKIVLQEDAIRRWEDYNLK